MAPHQSQKRALEVLMRLHLEQDSIFPVELSRGGADSPQNTELCDSDSLLSQVTQCVRFRGFPVPHDLQMILSFSRMLACGCSWGAIGASQTMHVEVFIGTIVLHSTHNPTCPPSVGGSCFPGIGGTGEPHSRQKRAKGSEGRGAKQCAHLRKSVSLWIRRI